MSKNNSEWMGIVRRLEAAYAVEGHEALAKMSGIEADLLYEEKAVALEAAELMVAKKPDHERWLLRRDHLRAEVSDVEGWLKQHVSPFNDPPPPAAHHERESPNTPALPSRAVDRTMTVNRMRQAMPATQKPKETPREPDRGSER